MTNGRIDLGRYIVLSIWFGCNNDCTICMLSDMKRGLAPLGFDRFRKVLSDVALSRRFDGLILSGAEVTTFEELETYVRFAASLRYFRRIQIQTNGRMLTDKGYLRRLVESGVNEFFVSIHGLEQVHDATARSEGAFRETTAGLANLRDFDVNVVTNTVLTKRNLHDIPRLMAFLAETAASEIHLWNYYPMKETDSRDMVVSLRDFTALLREVLPIAGASGKPLVLKSFPECLSIGPPGYFDSVYPETVLPDRFWREFGRCGFGGCVHRAECKTWECWGLSSAYIRKYGDERELLSPFR